VAFSPLTRIRSAKPDLLFAGWERGFLSPVLCAQTGSGRGPRIFTHFRRLPEHSKARIDRPFASNLQVPADPRQSDDGQGKEAGGAYKN